MSVTTNPIPEAMVEGFVAQVTPLLEAQNAPRRVRESWAEFCNNLRAWAKGDLKNDE
jgi:hypothetical protein